LQTELLQGERWKDHAIGKGVDEWRKMERNENLWGEEKDEDLEILRQLLTTN
jgi:hypothetical protein